MVSEVLEAEASVVAEQAEDGKPKNLYTMTIKSWRNKMAIKRTKSKPVQEGSSDPAPVKKSYTGFIVLGIVLLFLLLIAGMVIGTYNTLVKNDELVKAQWANVESSYQRRFDLIPNLVSTVQGAADFEKSTLTNVVEARSAWANAKSPDEKMETAGNLEGALSRLLVVVESYPQLRATQGFQDLQVQLEGTENRINVERNRYNEVVKEYNTKLRSFPTVIIAGMFGFEQKKPFEAKSGAEDAQKIEFK